MTVPFSITRRASAPAQGASSNVSMPPIRGLRMCRFSLIDQYGHFLFYQMEIVFSETGVSADLLEAKANEAVSRFDFYSMAIMLANLGDKSAEEALACVEDNLGRNC
jgi:hypothetical protein